MSEWISICPFSRDDFNGTKPTSNSDVTGSGGETPPITQPYDPIGGNKPPIIISTDYLLRDESGESITDQIGDPISLEGLRF